MFIRGLREKCLRIVFFLQNRVSEMGRGVFDFPLTLKTQIMNISKNACVPASLKFIAIAACVLVPASAFAETDSSANSKPTGSTPTAEKFRVVPYRAPGANNPVEEKSSLSIKVFYARALESSYKEYDKIFGDTDVDLGGLTVEYTKRLSPKWSFPTVDFVAALSFGGGSCDGDYAGELRGSSYNREYVASGNFHGEVSVITVDAEFGVNLSDTLSSNDSVLLFVGPRLGMNFLHVNRELRWNDTNVREYTNINGQYVNGVYSTRGSNEDDEWDLGLLYGIDAGSTISFDKNNALTLGIGYRASTARPLDINRQSWVRFFVGYQYSF